jgi:hypothetical protein
MARPKLTPWFRIDKDGHPERPGYYEVLYDGEKAKLDIPSVLYFSGNRWQKSELGWDSAFGNWDTKNERWRGLAEPPKESK